MENFKTVLDLLEPLAWAIGLIVAIGTLFLGAFRLWVMVLEYRRKLKPPPSSKENQLPSTEKKVEQNHSGTGNIVNVEGDKVAGDKVECFYKPLETMEFASIAFNIPVSINKNEPHQIQLRLSLSETIDKLKQSIIEEGKKEGAEIEVSDIMEAKLSGHMFGITAITPEIQAVSKSEYTEWKWEIQPKRTGKHNIHITLAALLKVNGESTSGKVRTFSRTIVVYVKTRQRVWEFILNNWQWLCAVVFFPIGLWLWKRWME